MGILGGGGVYAASGMRMWTTDVGVIGSVGHDFDMGWFAPLGLDTSCVQRNSLATPRAWQVFEFDGKRTQIPRIAEADWDAQLSRHTLPDGLPESLEAVHYFSTGSPADATMLASLRERGIRLGGEPLVTETITPEQREHVLETIAYYEVFSPGMPDLELLLGPGISVPDALRRIADYGPALVAVRQGASGSTVYHRESDRFWQVPAAEANVVDVTGGGNAYCGGLLTGWIESGDPLETAASASASASMVLEQLGPPPVNPPALERARWRREQVRQAIRPL